MSLSKPPDCSARVSDQLAKRLIFYQDSIGVDACGKLELIQRAEVHGV